MTTLQVRIDPVGDLLDATRTFTDIALSDPVSAVLIAVGGLITAVSVTVFFGLSAGGALSFVGRLLERPDRPD